MSSAEAKPEPESDEDGGDASYDGVSDGGYDEVDDDFEIDGFGDDQFLDNNDHGAGDGQANGNQSTSSSGVPPPETKDGELSVVLPSWAPNFLTSTSAAPTTSSSSNTVAMSAYEFAKLTAGSGSPLPGTSGLGISSTPQSSSSPKSVEVAKKSKQKASQMMQAHGHFWDPSHSTDWDQQKPSEMCTGRIARDLHSLYLDPIPGIQVYAYESNVTKMRCLIAGPEGTPYDGGYFQFYLRCPPDYPISHPRVRLLTTGEGTVRFNPNLYNNGKVCLSLIGTWAGPAWSPALNIATLLVSIQSLMGEFPFRNEPGYDSTPETSPESVSYNLWIQHETVRVAAIGMAKEAMGQVNVYRTVPQPGVAGEGRKRAADADGDGVVDSMPLLFRKAILSGFVRNYDKLTALCDKNIKLDGTANRSFACSSGSSTYQWGALKQQLTDLKATVEEELEKISPKKPKSDGSAEETKDSD